MSARRTSCLVLATALLAAALPAAAQAAWQAEPVPGGAGGFPPTTLGFDGQGRAITLFEGFTQGIPRWTGVASRGTDGAWTRAANLSGIGWGNAQALPYASSRALLVSLQVTGYGAYNRARFRLVWAPGRTTGSFDPLRQIDASAASPVAAANPGGQALVAYTRQGGSVIRVSERAKGGSFGTPRDLSASGASGAAVAINARGDRVVAWFRGDRVEARIRRAGGSWGSTLTVAHVTRSSNVRLAAVVAPSGRIGLAWETVDIRESRPVVLDAQAAVRPVDGGWRSTTLVHATLGTQSFAGGPAALPVIATNNDLWVAYTAAKGSGTGVKVSRVTNSAKATDTFYASGDSTTAALEDFAAGPQERLAAIWGEHDPATSTTRTFAALRPGLAAWSAPAELTAAGQIAVTGSKVAFSPVDGRAVVVRAVIENGASTIAASASDPMPMP